METVGHKLQTARLSKGLSLEDVARATRMRPERIADLEKDEFSTFPNIAYARSFLLLYAKYLGVDVSDFMHTLQGAARIASEDYDYLQNAPARKPARVRRASPSSAWPIMVLAGFVGMALFVAYLIKTGERLGPRFEGTSEQEEPVILKEEETATPITAAPMTSPTPTPTPTPIPSPTPAGAQGVPEDRLLDGLPIRKAEPIE